jgi:hypothetical protein
MAPKLSLIRGYCEENPSILAYTEDGAQDDFDDWSGQGTGSTSHRRKSSADAATIARWGSRLTSLSTGLLDAGSTLTTRAKQLGVGESTNRAIKQLRKSIEKVSTRVERSRSASMPAQHRQDCDLFGEAEDQPDEEREGIERGSNAEGDKLTRPHSWSWTQGCADLHVFHNVK